MADTLKPCPFCSHDDELQVLHQGAADELWFAVFCDFCCVYGPTSATAEGAVEIWNTRTIDDAPDARPDVVERIVGVIEQYGEGLVPELRIVCNWLVNHFRNDEDARGAIAALSSQPSQDGEAMRCASCGKPLSRDCAQCQKDWAS
jgi:hypothetical protein